jgi:hypothetical protein
VWAARPPLSLQVLVNPQGGEFDVVTSLESHMIAVTEPSLTSTWFTDYAWQMGQCECGAHLGWIFTKTTRFNGTGVDQFHAWNMNAVLVFDDILQAMTVD